MLIEDNGFFEYLQLQGGSPELVTKSELMTAVRERGAISDRQLTFYVSEGLVPKSVRVGSRAGAYPKIVVSLLRWILRARDGGVPIEVIKELLPVWKFLIRARSEHRLDLGELEYMARQHVTSVEGSLALPTLVSDVMTGLCPKCRGGETVVVKKDGSEVSMQETTTTVGFAIAHRSVGDEGEESVDWFAQTRILLCDYTNPHVDPSTVILGVRPGDELPPDPTTAHRSDHDRDGQVTHS